MGRRIKVRAIFGQTVITQHKCSKCGDLFFPEKNEFLCSYCSAKYKEGPFEIGNKVSEAVVQKFAPRINCRGTLPYKTVFKRDNHTCVYCGASSEDDCMVKLTVDHFIPFKYCQNNNIKNLVTACWDCHKYKGDKVFDSIDEAREYIRHRREKANGHSSHV